MGKNIIDKLTNVGASIARPLKNPTDSLNKLWKIVGVDDHIDP